MGHYNKFTLVCLLFLFSKAASAKISASEMVSKIEHNAISFDRAAKGGGVTQATIEHMVSLQKAKYPNFKPSMWFDHTVTVDGIYYIVWYDWTSNECSFTYNDLQELKNKGAQSQFRSNGTTLIDLHKSQISIKVCEKLYNFYSP